MGRWIMLVSLLLGLGLTSYFAADERTHTVAADRELQGMEGGGPIPTPRP